MKGRISVGSNLSLTYLYWDRRVESYYNPNCWVMYRITEALR